MKLCKDCKRYGKCGRFYSSMSNYAEECKDFDEIKPTNFERIKAMSVEEMAEAYVELIMQQKGTLEQIENTSATVIEAFKRDLFVQTVMWLESEVHEDE